MEQINLIKEIYKLTAEKERDNLRDILFSSHNSSSTESKIDDILIHIKIETINTLKYY